MSAEEQTVTYARFKQVLDERNDLRATLAERDGEIKVLKAGGAGDVQAAEAKLAKLQAKHDALVAEYSQAKAGWETGEAMLRAGITDGDLQDLVLYRWGRLPEQGRPGLGDWLGSEEGAKADPILAPHLQAATQQGHAALIEQIKAMGFVPADGAGAGEDPADGDKGGDPAGGGGDGGGATGDYTPEQVRAILANLEAKRGGAQTQQPNPNAGVRAAPPARGLDPQSFQGMSLEEKRRNIEAFEAPLKGGG